MPETLSHYRIVRMLGKGGMGEVYLGWDPRLERHVALKVLATELAQDAERLRRFTREAKAASAIRHPNVTQIYEIGEAEGQAFIAMEYVEGESLEARLRARSLSLAETLDIAIESADALDAAHSQGVTHRDVKPGNIMVLPRGRIKVMDFGLAKMTRPESPDGVQRLDDEAKTTTGVVLGTIQYMSPEQALGREVDHRTDLFSLGVTAYEMSTGRLPFAGATVGETFDQILHGEPIPLSRWNPRVPAELERIVGKCLEKDRDDRYQSARDLLLDLRGLRRNSGPLRVAIAPASGGPVDERGPLARLFAFMAPSPMRWWAIDHLTAVLLFTPLWIYLAWKAKGWISGRLGGGLFVAVLTCQAVTSTLRLHLLVGSITLKHETLTHEIRRIGPWIRTTDLVLMAVVLVMAVRIAESHTEMAAVLLGLAVAGLVKFLLADPSVTREAVSSPGDRDRSST